MHNMRLWSRYKPFEIELSFQKTIYIDVNMFTIVDRSLDILKGNLFNYFAYFQEFYFILTQSRHYSFIEVKQILNKYQLNILFIMFCIYVT